ncbi:cyclin ccl1 [Aspergillus sp. HF37]|nr:cyclin ccl1 [Aspergillus sp. HF37]
MIEDDIYRTSSQYRLWSFTQDSLRSLRDTTNAVASDRVRAARRRMQPASSAAATPNPSGSDTDSKRDEKPVECLTPDEEQDLVRYYCEQTLELGERYRPAIPTIVRSTAIQYLRRFYLTNSPMTYHPKTIMACALFLATKTENYYMSLRHFADALPPDITGDDVIAPEFLLMQGLRFTFDVRHPFRGLEGGIMELQAIAQGLGQPAPHFPAQTAESLQKGLLAVPPPPSTPSSSSSSSSTTDRLARAHGTTRETLKTAAQMTDAYFLYTPSQIWLSAFYLADRPLAEFYLDTKLGSDSEMGGILHTLRTKLLHTLSSCSALLQSYTPSTADADQMKNLKRIAKKRHHCANPDKANLAGRKRDPAVAGAGGGGETGTSESEVDRMAKKRKLEREQRETDGKELFGGELVTNRTKEALQEQQQQDAQPEGAG